MASVGPAQKEAVVRVQAAFARLPQDNLIFQQCMSSQDSVQDVLEALSRSGSVFKKRKSTKLLDGFKRYTTWMVNISSAVDTAVQTSSGIACPIWAPIKFVLKVCHDHVAAAEQILSLVQILSENLPRLELYERLHDDPRFQMSLVDMFADILEFSFAAYRFLGRRTHARIGKLIGSNIENELGDVINRIKHRTKTIDATAGALSQEREAQFIKETRSRQRHDARINAMRWLRPSQINDSIQRNLAARTGGTCEWIMKEPDFQSWLKYVLPPLKSGILVIHGASGCGKSILASFIYSTLQTGEINQILQRSTVLYFSFSSSDMDRQTLDSCARTLLSQLLEQSSGDELSPLFTSLMEKGAPTTSEIFDVLQKAIEMHSTPVRAIIDGIDECSDQKDTTAKFLLENLPTLPNLSLVLLGQSHTMTKLCASAKCHRISTISITSDTNVKDMHTVVDHLLSHCTVLSTSSARDEILRTLLERADGMFLWAKLMVDYLNASVCDDEVLKRLSDLPYGLEKTYVNVLNRLADQLDKHQQRLVGYLFSFAVCCGRPLRFEEVRLAYALAIKPNSGTSKLESFMLRIQPEDVIELCGGLLSYTDGAIRLIHNSVRDFLVQPWEDLAGVTKSILRDFHVDLTSSHRVLSTVCVRYFVEVDLTKLQWEHLTSLESVHSQQPFLDYACAYMAYHINRSDMSPGEISETMLVFSESDQFFYALEYIFAYGMNDASLQMQVELWALLELLMTNADTLKLMPSIKSRCDQEQNERVSNFGEMDSRTMRWSFFNEAILSYADRTMHDKSLHEEAAEDSNTAIHAHENSRIASCKSPKSCRPQQELDHTSMSAPERNHRYRRFLRQKDISSMINHVNDFSQVSNSLSLGKQFEVIFRILQHASLPRKIADPLHALWNLIKQKAASMPLLHLVAVTQFYHAFGRNEEAFEIGNICLGRMKDRDTTLGILVQSIMGVVAYKLDKDELAVEYSEYAIPKMDALLGPMKYTMFNAKIFLVCSYQRTNRYGDAIRLLRVLIEDRLTFHKVDKKRRNRAYLKLGICLYDQKNDDREAVTVLRKYLDLSPKVHDGMSLSDRGCIRVAYYSLAHLHHDLCEFEVALQYIEMYQNFTREFCKPYPSEARGMKKLRALILCRESRSSEDARNLFREALRDYIQDSCEASLQSATKKCSCTLYVWYKHLTEDDLVSAENAVDVYSDLWQTYQAVHEIRGRCVDFSDCCSSNDAHYDLARLHLNAYQYDAAKEYLVRCQDGLADSKENSRRAFMIRLNLSYAERELGNWKAAERQADKALELFERYPWSPKDRMNGLRYIMEEKIRLCDLNCAEYMRQPSIIH